MSARRASYRKCMRFAQESGLLDRRTIGSEKPEQMDETLRLLAKYPAKKLIGS